MQTSQGLSASFCYGQGPSTAWGPLAAQQQGLLQLAQAGRLVRHTSVDEGMLASAAAASLTAHGARRVAVSLPASPRRAAGSPPAARRPPPLLNLHGVGDRLQLTAQRTAPAAAAGRRRASSRGSTQSAAYGKQQSEPQLSPVLEALAPSVPALVLPAQHEQAELAAEDLADLAGLSRWAG